MTLVKNALLTNHTGSLKLCQHPLIRLAKNYLHAAPSKLVGHIVQSLYARHVHERYLAQSNHQDLRICVRTCQRMLEVINGPKKTLDLQCQTPSRRQVDA